MKQIAPRVLLVSRPSLVLEGICDYLTEVGGEQWLAKRLDQDTINPGQALVEFAGRLCYRSWTPGLNPNVSRIRTDQGDYLRNLLQSGHGSVFEHATYSFIFHNVSRVFTHELVRHRAGVAISQESLRFVRLKDISCWFPRSLEQELTDNDGDGLWQRWVSIVESIEDFQQRAADHLGLDEEGVPFSRKKEMTSAMRRMLPEGVATVVLWTANIRAIRHCIEARTARSAEEEIRLVFDQVASIMVREVPDVFADYVRTPVPGTSAGEWTTDFMKV